MESKEAVPQLDETKLTTLETKSEEETKLDSKSEQDPNSNSDNNNSDNNNDNNEPHREITHPKPLEEEEKKRMQAIFGTPKDQLAKYVVGKKDHKEKLSDHQAQATIYFKNCEKL